MRVLGTIKGIGQNDIFLRNIIIINQYLKVFPAFFIHIVLI